MPLGTLFINYYTAEFSNYRKAVSIAQNEARNNNEKRYVVPSENGFRIRKEAPSDESESVTVIQADGSFSVPRPLYDHYSL